MPEGDVLGRSTVFSVVRLELKRQSDEGKGGWRGWMVYLLRDGVGHVLGGEGISA